MLFYYLFCNVWIWHFIYQYEKCTSHVQDTIQQISTSSCLFKKVSRSQKLVSVSWNDFANSNQCRCFSATFLVVLWNVILHWIFEVHFMHYKSLALLLYIFIASRILLKLKKLISLVWDLLSGQDERDIIYKIRYKI